MKVFLFNSELKVYAAVAETREEAIELINNKIACINEAYWNEPNIPEIIREHRKKGFYFDPEEFHETVLEMGYGFVGNFELEQGEAIVYQHANE